MDISTYISSGVIESYTLGQLSETEMSEVEAFAMQYPEIQHEIALNQAALEKYCELYKEEVPAHTKEKLFEKIELEKETKTIEFEPEMSIQSPLKVYWSAASLIFIALSITLNGYLYDSLQKTQSKLSDAIAQSNQLLSDNSLSKVKYDGLSKQLEIVNQPDNKIIALAGLKIAPEASARILWNTKTKEVYISLLDLPTIPSNKQYQFWAIVDGKPVDGGLIETTNSSTKFLQMKSFENAQAFAISLENKGGAASPTMEAIYVMGSI